MKGRRIKRKLVLGILLFSLMLIGCDWATISPTSAHADTPSALAGVRQACTSFYLDNGDHSIFGANQDNRIDAGLLFVNKRHVLKTAWDPSTSGEYARWISNYGSVTIVHAGYQLPWAGMNEAGLMMSTMALAETQNPAPDKRPPLASSFWVQYQLDNHSTVEEVLESNSQIRIADTVDHYLVADRKGNCAIIEFLEGKMVAHTGESLPVKALTNSIYQESVSAWENGIRWAAKVRWVDPDSPIAKAGIKAEDWIIAVDGVKLDGNQPPENLFSKLLSQYEVGDEAKFTIRRQRDQSIFPVTVKLGSRMTEKGEEVLSMGPFSFSLSTSLDRFATVADRLEAFEPINSGEAIAHAFKTLDAVASDFTAWSIVFDPANLRVRFLTNQNPQVRFVDLSKLAFSSETPVMMIDIHADVSGDISNDLVVYCHEVSLDHTISFIEQYEGLDLQPFLADALLGGFERFPCKGGDASAIENAGLLLKDGPPLLPPRVRWIILALFRRLWLVWVPLTFLSLAFVIWHLARRQAASWITGLAWVLVLALLGPFGLLVYLLTHRKRRIKKA